MGKKSRVPGLPKLGSKRQREEIATRALLLGGRYDKHTSMIIVETTNDNGPGMIPSWWQEYYDVNGNPLTQKEGRERQRQAQRRYRGRGDGFVPAIGQRFDRSKYFNTFSKSISADIFSKKMVADFEKSTAFSKVILDEAERIRQEEDSHILDALRYASLGSSIKITNKHIITSEVT